MNSVSRLLPIALIVILLSTFGAGPTLGEARPVQHQRAGVDDLLDATLRLDPYLQFGAREEPNRRVRVIVQKTSRLIGSRVISLAAGAPIIEEFPFINALVIELPLGNLLALAQVPGIRIITHDGPVVAQAIETDPIETSYGFTVGADRVWNSENRALRATGRGVTVAVIDTGVNRSHPSLGSDVTCVNTNRRSSGCDDPHGHGTHVAGIISGQDAAGRYVGVAPDARVVAVKIADNDGVALESDLIRGLQWAHENRSAQQIRVVNLSVSGATPTSYVFSPIDNAVEQLWSSGIVVVASSGNAGTERDATWYPPGNDPFVITVGCHDDNLTRETGDDSLCFFSSRGRTQDGFAKPDIIAPGRRIVSALAGRNTVLGRELSDRIVDEDYLRLSGTSMSAPVVSGIVALLLERHPRMTPDQVKWLLTSTEARYPGQASNDQAGLVDAFAAMEFQQNGGRLGAANRGLLPSLGILNLLGGLVGWDKSYYRESYWDKSYYRNVEELNAHFD